MADLFVDDGIWEGPPGRAEGKAQIAALFREFSVIPFIVHYLANPLIEVEDDVQR